MDLTARMPLVNGSPAPMANASRQERNAMDTRTVTMGQMRMQQPVGITTVDTNIGVNGESFQYIVDLHAPMANVSRKNANVMEGRIVMMGAMRPQRHVEPIVRR